jgi:nitric oxide reductase NorQ protein
MLYLDEVAEAREDVIVVLHPLADHRRQLFVDRLDETLTAGPGFMLVASFNPGYRRGSRSSSRRPGSASSPIALRLPGARARGRDRRPPRPARAGAAKRLVALAGKIRKLDELGLAETVSTRLWSTPAS